jgi:hypothetical protein
MSHRMRSGWAHALALVSSLLLTLGTVGPAAATDPLEPDHAQITGLGGVQWGGALHAAEGRVEIDSAPTYTVQAAVRTQEDGFVVLSYTRQSTVARIRFDDGRPGSRFDLDVGYLQLGGELDVKRYRHLVPFIGLTLGATHLTPREPGAWTEWFFSGTATAGARIPITKNFGLRTQLRLLATLISGDTSVYCVSSGGAACALSIDDAAGFVQGDLTAGLYVAF